MSEIPRMPLAITGIGLRLPGASSLAELAELLHARKVVIAPLPDARLDRELHFRPGPPTPGFSSTELGAAVLATPPSAVADVLPAGLAAVADPAHLTFLSAALDAVADAGLAPGASGDRRVGVLVGHAGPSDHAGDLLFAQEAEALAAVVPELPELGRLAPHERDSLAGELAHRTRSRHPWPPHDGRWALAASAAAHLVAACLGSVRLCWTVDAACASGLAAAFLAQRLIAGGHIDLAIVGGCSFSQWSSLVLFSQAGALSARGSFPFDARADGFVSADGHVAVVLEPLPSAAARGRRPHAVLRRIAGACDGRARSLWAPAVRGQVKAIARCYDDEIPAASVQVIEAHCTGTQLGDATEAQALAEVFGPAAAGRRLPVASLKGNLGHTRESAGLAGLLSLVTALRSGTVSPAAGFETPSPAIDWGTVPLRVPLSPEPWPELPGVPRRGAVSSMGIGGLDYHAVVDEPPGPAAPAEAVPPAAEPIAVVGAGLLHPRAASLAALAQALATPPPPPPTDSSGRVPTSAAGAPIAGRHTLAGWRPDWRRYGLPPRQVESADPLHLMFLEVATQALADAGWDPSSLALRGETAVFVGTAFGSGFSRRVNVGLRAAGLARELRQALAARGVPAEEAQAAAAAALRRWRESYPIADEWGSYSPSTFASRLAKHFDLQGPCAALDCDEDSSFAALLAALAALRAGDCDVAVCCAGQSGAGPAVGESYLRVGWLREGNGVHLADAAVALVLRRASDARRDGQRILAELDRVEHRFRFADPLAALAEVGRALPADTLAGVTAGPGIDPERERLALAGERAGGRWLALAPTLGTAQGGDGLLSLLAAIAVAGAAAGARPAPFAAYGASFGGSATVVGGRAFPSPAPGPRRVSAAAATGRACIVRLGAENPERLAHRLRQAVADPESAWREAAAAAGFAARDAWRLAVVADSPSALAARLALVETVPVPADRWPALHEQGVFPHQRPPRPPRLAALSPGQGSQYPGMLRGLVAEVAAARAALEEVDRALADLAQPSWEALAWEQPLAARLGTDVWLTQAAVLGGDAIVSAALGSLGVRPDVVAGHSLGEMAALVAAGAWRVEDALRLAWTRSRLFASLPESPGRLVSTSLCDAAAAALGRRLAGRGEVALAIRNSPEQAVLAVAGGLVDEVLAELARSGEAARVLPVPLPYHSQLLAPVQEDWEHAVSQAPLAPPRIPFLTWVDAAYIGEPAGLRRCLAAQHLHRLDFVRLVERLWGDGVRVFFETGPGSILTRLVRSILRGREALALSLDARGVTAAEQLLRAQALLETLDLGRGPGAAAPHGRTVPYRLSRSLPPPVREGIVHVDATSRRRGGRDAGQTGPAAPRASAAAPSPPADEVEELLLAFVCEQTGFPREVVGLDQDLEAELGIDSLRKAQMLLAARDRFGITAPVTASGLALGQLSTLREVARLIRSLRAAPPTPTAPPPAAPAPGTPAAGEPPPLPPVTPGGTVRRWVVRSEPLAAAASQPPGLLPTLLVGASPTVAAMAAALHAAGSPVRQCPDAAAGMEALPALPLPRRLLLATALDTGAEWFDADASVRRRALEMHGLQVFELVRRWVASLESAGGCAGAELVCATAGGGAPRPGRAAAPAGGALWGLGRALRRERPELRVVTLDIPADEPPGRAAQALLAALGSPPDERGWARGRQFRPTLLAAELETAEAVAAALAPALSPGAVWLVTGGGRGVTALAARELGARFGVKLHLVGRTSPDPVPESWLAAPADGDERLRAEVEHRARLSGLAPDRAWAEAQARIELQRVLAANAAAGVDCTYHRADVTDPESLRPILARIRAAGTPLRGLLHGAGCEHASALEKKDETLVRATLESKVLGLQHLLALTRDEPLLAVVAFGSVAALLGNHGQTDYALANGLLASLLSSWRETTGVRAATIMWQAWADAGMATRGAARLALRAAGRVLMPAGEGCRLFLRELQAGLPDPEPVFLDDPAPLLAPGTLTVSAARVHSPAAGRPPALLDRLYRDAAGRAAGGEMLLDASTQPFLRDHRLDGVPLLPAVAMLEAMAEGALAGLPPAAPVLVRDWRIEVALRVPFGHRCFARVTCEPGAAAARTRLYGDRLNARGSLTDADALVSEAVIARAGAAPPAPAPPPATDLSAWREPRRPDGADAAPDAGIWLGPTLRSLRRYRLGARGGTAVLAVPAPTALRPDRPDGVWCTPAALLDGCLVACGVFCREVLGAICLPVGADELWLTGFPAPGGEAVLSFALVGRTADRIDMEFVLRAPGEDVVFLCRGLHATPLRPAARP